MNIILGAGIIGLFIGYNLLKKGQKVEIFDTLEHHNAAWKASVGMLAPVIEAKTDEYELFKLMTESKSIWDNFLLDNKLRKKIGLKKNSSLLIAENYDDLEKIKNKKEFFKNLGYESKLLSAQETLKIEPELNSNIVGSLYCLNQNQVNPVFLRNFLISEINSFGVNIKKLREVQKIRILKNCIELDKTKINAKNIIIACGAWSSNLLKKSFDISIPTIPLKGVSLLIDAGRELFKNNIWFKNIYVTQRSDNILSIGATEQERGFDDKIRMDELYFLTKNIWQSFPELENLKLVDIKSGIRSGIVDGNPVMGSIDCISENLICAFGHYRHGILLAPITAEIICDIVLNKKNKMHKDFFSPQRFNL